MQWASSRISPINPYRFKFLQVDARSLLEVTLVSLRPEVLALVHTTTSMSSASTSSNDYCQGKKKKEPENLKAENLGNRAS